MKVARPLRRGFTLVELLAVLVILGILVSLVTAAVISARSSARRAKILMEIDSLQTALNNYKERFGEYPPDCAGLASTNSTHRTLERRTIVRHLMKAFSGLKIHVQWPISGCPYPNATNIDQQYENVRQYITRVTNNQLDLNALDASTSMVFFLGGLPAQVGSTRMPGFSADASNPFNPNSSSRLQPFFEFDPTRLIEYNTNQPAGTSTTLRWLRYVPDTGSSAGRVPYLYFRARGQGLRIRAITAAQPPHYETAQPSPGYDDMGQWGPQQMWTSNVTVDQGTNSAERVYPYLLCRRNSSAQWRADRWPNDKTFQIISAGLDGRYGTTNIVPAEAATLVNRAASISRAEADNLTNFSGGTLEDAVQ